MQDVVIIGGGLAGLSAALHLAERGVGVTVLERQPLMGGLAGSFTQEGRRYPNAYHQILEGDRPLRQFMARLGLADQIRWRRISMAFSMDRDIYTLGGPRQALRFPLSLRTKASILRLVARTVLLPRDPSEAHIDAETWIHRNASEAACEEFFDRLTQLKFGLPCRALSAAWLRERLMGREGLGRFGYLPDTDWTHALVARLTQRLEERGVHLATSTPVTAVQVDGGRITGVVAEGLATLRPRAVISTLPPPLLVGMVPALAASPLADIRYSGVVSCVVATRQAVPLTHYWTNFLRPFYSFGGIFRLDLLNGSLGMPGDALLNFATHVGDPGAPSLLSRGEDEIVAAYLSDFQRRFGVALTPRWAQVSRIRHYSPIFVRAYRNPPIRVPELGNLYLAGNYRTCPTLASTGTAIASGLQCARLLWHHLRPGGAGAH